MKESYIQNKIKKELELNGAYVIKVMSAGVAGVPDLIACYKGVFIGIEVKAPNKLKTVTPLQLVNIELIKKTGGKAIVASDTLPVIQLLREIDNDKL